MYFKENWKYWDIHVYVIHSGQTHSQHRFYLFVPPLTIYQFIFCLFQVVIVKPKLDKDRKRILEHRAKSRSRGADKSKYDESQMES